MTSNDQNMNDLLRIGSVNAVRGSSIEIVVDADKNEPSLIHKGEIIQNVTVGSFIIIHRGYRRLVVKVQEEFLAENRDWPAGKYRRDNEHYRRILKQRYWELTPTAFFHMVELSHHSLEILHT